MSTYVTHRFVAPRAHPLRSRRRIRCFRVGRAKCCVHCAADGLLRRGRQVALVTDAIQSLDPDKGWQSLDDCGSAALGFSRPASFRSRNSVVRPLCVSTYKCAEKPSKTEFFDGALVRRPPTSGCGFRAPRYRTLSRPTIPSTESRGDGTRVAFSASDALNIIRT